MKIYELPGHLIAKNEIAKEIFERANHGDPVLIEDTDSGEYFRVCAPIKEECTGYVYFIQQGMFGPIKIGYSSRSGEKRLSEGKTYSPYKLYFLGELPGSVSDEQTLHKKFSEYRMEGEWFENYTEILFFMNKLLSGEISFADVPTLKKTRYKMKIKIGRTIETVTPGPANKVLQRDPTRAEQISLC